MPNENVYDAVTARILATLDAGVIPWQRDWAVSSGMPVNHATGKPYRGVNILTLLCAGYPTNRWMTYKQAQDAGMQVRKGSKGMPVVFWKFDRKKDDGGKEQTFAFGRCYTVFNVSQLDGYTAELPFDVVPFEPIQSASLIADRFFASHGAPKLFHAGSQPYYSPADDTICMPHPSSFGSAHGYYSTLFHESAHSTGHPSRLSRFEVGKGRTDKQEYSKEELVAEFTAAFLSAESGITNEALHANQAAYIQAWAHAIKNDRTLVLSAAQRAQHACDFILGRHASQALCDEDAA
jgi:antirestriction protein ArdC